jgi:hypothetical protein
MIGSRSVLAVWNSRMIEAEVRRPARILPPFTRGTLEENTQTEASGVATMGAEILWAV